MSVSSPPGGQSPVDCRAAIEGRCAIEVQRDADRRDPARGRGRGPGADVIREHASVARRNSRGRRSTPTPRCRTRAAAGAGADNARLKRLYADLALENAGTQDFSSQAVAPPARRQFVAGLVAVHGLTLCAPAGSPASPATYYAPPQDAFDRGRHGHRGADRGRRRASELGSRSLRPSAACSATWERERRTASTERSGSPPTPRQASCAGARGAAAAAPAR